MLQTQIMLHETDNTTAVATENEGTVGFNGSEASHSLNTFEPLPELHTPHKRRRTILWLGIALAVLDLCCLPITYYYALKFATHLSLQDVFAVITAVYGMLSFAHYGLRSLKLFRSKVSPKWRPVGWTKWGMMEFLQINILVVITLVEVELVAATAPHSPIIRLCAMPSPTICFYMGFLFCISATLAQLRKPLPFNMSSSDKGTPWKPALLAFVEDAGAIEGQGGVEYRGQVMRRYAVSARFRRMILVLTWGWGVMLLCVATLTTILVMLLNEDVAFGVGWGLPWVWCSILAFISIAYVKSQLKAERAEWAEKESAGATLTV